MLFFSIGMPSPFAEWCDQVVLRLVNRVLGRAQLVGGNTLDEIGLALVTAQTDHLVVAARQPIESLRAAIAACGHPLIAVMDAPYTALENLVVRHRLDFVAATRATASSCSTMLDYMLMSGGSVLRAGQDDQDPIGTAAIISRCFSFDLTLTELSAIVAEVPPLNDPKMEPGRFCWDNLDPALRGVAYGALEGFAEYFRGGRLSEIKWTRELFYLGDDPQQTGCQIVSLAGGVRNLIFGPYIVLPPGQWGAMVSLAISKEGVGTDFGVEVIAGPECIRLSYASITANNEGICRAALAFAIDRQTAQPICLRIANLQPCSAGLLALLDVSLTPQAMTAADMPAEISAALGL
jgi:hypothetical protein